MILDLLNKRHFVQSMLTEFSNSVAYRNIYYSKAIFYWWCHEQSILSQDAISEHGKVGSQNWHITVSAYSAAGGENDQQKLQYF